MVRIIAGTLMEIGGGKYPVVKMATDTRNDDEKFYMADMEIVD